MNIDNNVLKLCDLGSAMSAGKNEVIPYLAPKFSKFAGTVVVYHQF